MSNLFKESKYFGIWLCAMILSACSVSDGNSLAGIEGTGDKVSAKGSVTKFGSIYVNGIHFNTDTSEFYIDGEPANETDIQQGMVVYIEGKPGSTDSEAIAETVSFNYLVRGEIDNIINTSSDQRLITVLGYSILITEDAMIQGSSFDQLSIGDSIAVSGFTNVDHTIIATRIDVTAASDTITISGAITSLEGDIISIESHDLDVSLSSANIHGGTLSDLAIGTNITITGTPETNNTAIVALSILITPNHAKAARSISAEGIISQFNSISDFILNGNQINAASALTTGENIALLSSGSRITIKGSIDSSGVFNATNLHSHHQSATRLSGKITNIDTRAETITVSGLEFHIDSYTRFEDLGPRSNRYVSLEDLYIGDNVDLFSLSFNQKNIAITVRRKPSTYSTELKIKGRITSFVDSNHFYLSGILVNAENISEEILQELNQDNMVFVNGRYDESNTFIATEIYIFKYNCTSFKEDDCKKQRLEPKHPDDGQPFEEEQMLKEGIEFDWDPEFDKQLPSQNQEKGIIKN